MLKQKLHGFTLLEMLISISLGLFLSILLIKIYLWQVELHHDMEDMIFLDHNGILALHMLANDIRSADQIEIEEQGNKIILFKKAINPKENKIVSYYIKENELRKSIVIVNQKPDTNAMVAGVQKLQAIQKSAFINVKIDLNAPHGMKEILYEKIKPENEKF